MTTEAVYARYSSHAQDSGTSIEVQMEACERAAGHPLTRYIDAARTGRTVGGRDALQQLLRDAEAGRITRLWLYKYDRLGRAAETHVIVRDLEECGVEVVSVTEGRDALARGIQLVVAQDYSRVLAQRTRDGLIKRHEQGAWTGGPAPYGYQIVEAGGIKKLAISPAEAEAIQHIVADYLGQSIGLKAIACRLESRGIMPRSAKFWSFTTIRNILRNPMLVGRVEYNRRSMKLNRATGRRVHRANQSDRIRSYTDESLRVLDDTTWTALQETLASRAVPQGSAGSRGVKPFTGLLRCAECDSPMYSQKSSNRKGAYRYCVCGTRQRRGDAGCSNRTRVREDSLMQQVTDAFGAIFYHRDAIIDKAIERAREQVGDIRQQRSQLQRQIDDIDQRITTLASLLSDPDSSPSAAKALLRQIGELEHHRDQLQTSLSQLVEAANVNTERLARAVEQAFSEAQASLSNVATDAQLNRFVSDFIGPMIMHRDGRIVPAANKNAPASAEACSSHVMGGIAGGGFEPPTSGL